MVVEFDPRGTVAWANPQFLSTTGYALSDIVGKHQAMFCPAEDLTSGSYRRLWDGLAAGGHWRGRVRCITAAGAERWLQAVYAPVLDEFGHAKSVIELATDITEEVGAAREVSLQLAASLRALADDAEDQTRRNELLERLRNVVAAIAALSEQTKLLSLNASIEAGRAGSAGRTFAIFAAEIKKVAADTRAATEEARRLIED